MPLERSQISRLHVTSVPAGDVTYLHIRGLPNNSFSSGCSNLEVRTVGNEIRLQANMLLIRRGGPFDYVLTVPAGVRRVVFGNQRKEIWPNDEGGRLYSESERKALEAAIREFRTSKPDLTLADYYVFVEKDFDASPAATGHYSIVFYQDGPAPCSVSELHRYWVSKSDGTVISKGRSYAGQMLLLEQLGKVEGMSWILNHEHPAAKAEARQL